MAATSTMAPNMARKRREPDLTLYSGRLAARILELREAAGLTKEQMAERLCVPYSTYATYENGSVEWPSDLTPQFAAIVGVSPRTVYPRD